MQQSYRPEIDGMRAVAVVAVVLYHAGLPAIGGGFAGVDVFFVISGYLITRLILAEEAAGRFGLLRFFERRARRILPALLLVMAAAAPFAFWLMFPDELRRFGESALSALLLVSNVYFLNTQDYFGWSADRQVLLHVWSLSVEEQFYLLFPLLFLATMRFSRRAFLGAIAALGLASLALAQFGGLFQAQPFVFRWLSPPGWGFYLLPTRAWELLLGAAIAASALDHPGWRDKLPPVLREAGAIAGIAMIVASFLIYRRSTPFPSAYALAPTLGTALVIVFARPGMLAHRVLSARLLVFVGLISYSLYLWHQTLLAFSRLYLIRGMGPWWAAGAIGLSFGFAYLSWRFVERPFRDRRAMPARLFWPTVVASLCLLAAVGFAARTFGARAPADTQIAAIWNRINGNVGFDRRCVFDGAFTPLPECANGASPRAIVWGDSFAMHVVDAVAAANPSLPLEQATMPVCGPIPGLAPMVSAYREDWGQRCLAFNDTVLRHILGNPEIRDVVLGIHIATYVSGDLRTFDGQAVWRSTPADIHAALLRTVRRLEEAGKRVTLVSSPPRSGFDTGRCLAAAAWRGLAEGACDFRLDGHFHNALMTAFLRGLEADGVRLVWLPELICPGGVCRAEMSGVFLFRDEGHLTGEGARLLGATSDAFRLGPR